jgi:hypothetical protein
MVAKAVLLCKNTNCLSAEVLTKEEAQRSTTEATEERNFQTINIYFWPSLKELAVPVQPSLIRVIRLRLSTPIWLGRLRRTSRARQASVGAFGYAGRRRRTACNLYYQNKFLAIIIIGPPYVYALASFAAHGRSPWPP